jgi:hypothetical protein
MKKLLQCMSLLMAQSGHGNRAADCPLLGVKRTSVELGNGWAAIRR